MGVHDNSCVLDLQLKKDFDGKCEAYMMSNSVFPEERDYEVVAAMVMGFGGDANAARRANPDLLVQLRERVRDTKVSSAKQCTPGCRSPLCYTEVPSS